MDQQRKVLNLVDSLVNPSKHIKKNWKQFPSFSKLEDKRIFPSASYEASISMKPKADKDIAKKENYSQIQQPSNSIRKIITLTKWDLFLEYKDGLMYKTWST